MHRIVFATTLVALLGAGSDTALTADGLSHYRDFTLGTTVATVAATTRVPVSVFRTLYDKPALLQEFEWRPSHYATSDAQADTIDQITFRFFNDQLSQMVVAYDNQQTAGMTNADMVTAIAGIYGTPAARRGPEQSDLGASVARWQTTSALVDLYRGTDAWRLVLTSRTLDAAARTAAALAQRQEEREAPARELAQRKQDEAAERARHDDVRRTNKAAFQP